MEVVGLVYGVSKKTNKPYTILHVTGSFESYVQGASGVKAENYCVAKPLTCKVGQHVELVYGVGYAGKAVVEDVRILDK